MDYQITMCYQQKYTKIYKKENKYTSYMFNKIAYHNYLHITKTAKITSDLDIVRVANSFG